MIERARLVNPSAGPAAVELVRTRTSVVRTFGRVGALDGYQREDFSEESFAQRVFGDHVRRLVGRGYVPGAHNPGLAALIRESDDVAAYGVYADWLAERDDPRAELIQVQMQLESKPEDVALNAEEARLLAEFGAQLTMPGWRIESSFTWRRGFVDSIDFFSNYGGGYSWPSNWLDGIVVRPQTPPWHLLRSVIRHPSGALLRRVTESRGQPRPPRRGFQHYRVVWDAAPGWGNVVIRLLPDGPFQAL